MSELEKPCKPWYGCQHRDCATIMTHPETALFVYEKKVWCEDCLLTEVGYEALGGLSKFVPEHKATIAQQQAEIERLRIALHDAIKRPLGVVPVTAEEFYSPPQSDTPPTKEG